MAKYLVEASYTREGVAGVQDKGGSSRRDAVTEMAAGLGGKVESFYFGFGDADAVVIVDVPDNLTAVALSLAVNASGAVTLKTVPLLTPEEVDQATKKTVSYRAPGH